MFNEIAVKMFHWHQKFQDHQSWSSNNCHSLPNWSRNFGCTPKGSTKFHDPPTPNPPGQLTINDPKYTAQALQFTKQNLGSPYKISKYCLPSYSHHTHICTDSHTNTTRTQTHIQKIHTHTLTHTLREYQREKCQLYLMFLILYPLRRNEWTLTDFL